MDQQKIERRRFLGDLLFAGGALTLAAVAARMASGMAAPAETPNCTAPTPCATSAPATPDLPRTDATPAVQLPRLDEPNPAGGARAPVNVPMPGESMPPVHRPPAPATPKPLFRPEDV